MAQADETFYNHLRKYFLEAILVYMYACAYSAILCWISLLWKYAHFLSPITHTHNRLSIMDFLTNLPVWIMILYNSCLLWGLRMEEFYYIHLQFTSYMYMYV
jgi:hypothetical protein